MRMKKWLVRLAIFALTLIALAAVGVIGLWTFTGFGSASAKAKERYREWQAVGLPVTKAEVDPRPLPRPSENAASLVQAARTILEPLRSEKSVSFSSEKSFSSGAMADFIRDREAFLAKMEEASKRPHLNFERDWDMGADLLVPEFADLKLAAKLFAARAEIRAKRGDEPGMLADLTAARRLAKLVSAEPAPIAGLVGMAMDDATMLGLGRCASLYADDPEILGAMKKIMEDTAFTVDQEAAIRSEVYTGLATFRRLSNKDVIEMITSPDSCSFLPDSPRMNVTEGLPTQQLPRAVYSELAAYWNEFYPRIIDPSEDQTRVAADQAFRQQQMMESKSEPKRVAAHFCWSIDAFALSFQRGSARQKCGLAYLAVLEFRARNGKWPSNLADAGVTGSAALDPIDGRPLKYRFSASSARIWSVGSNKFDDGGVTKEEARSSGSYSAHDDVWVHPWPGRAQ